MCAGTGSGLCLAIGGLLQPTLILQAGRAEGPRVGPDSMLDHLSSPESQAVAASGF